MNKAWLGTAGVIVVTGVAVVAVQRADNAALRREVALLRLEVKSLAIAAKSAGAGAATSTPAGGGAAAANGVEITRAAENSELVKLREEMSALQKSTADIAKFAQLAQTVKTLEKSSDGVPTNLIPSAALKNSGKATPEASTQTALWAAVSGDVEALAETLMFTASAQKKADAWFATLPDATRQQYGSPEKVVALMIAKDADSLTGMQVIGQQEVGPDNVGVRVRLAGADGKTKDDTLFMHRGADGWKMVLPDPVLEKFARQLAKGK
jgi:hypothetical protein